MMNKPIELQTPSAIYYQKCQEGFITEDPLQIKVLKELDRVYQDLIKEYRHRSGWLSVFRKAKLVKGMYLWGPVGAGKTFLMDCFFQSLPFPKKLRMHFYQFMQRIHRELTLLQGKEDPLQWIAKKIAAETLVLCFDEFIVSDITDAMLLGRLLGALFSNGVSLVTTSNTPPKDLYKNGLQRSRFLPAITLIEQKTEVIVIPATLDYRLRHLKEAGVFYTPLNDETERQMEQLFNKLAHGQVWTDPLLINDRMITVHKRTNEIVWFDFSSICSVPRSQLDYLQIAKLFKVVFISQIPIIPPEDRDTISLFISLVDVLYDARVRIVISAAESVEKLYDKGYKLLEYARTHSRLLEMQSKDYFAGEED